MKHTTPAASGAWLTTKISAMKKAKAASMATRPS